MKQIKRIYDHGPVATLALCLMCFIACFYVGLTLKMDSIIHARLSFYALPAAISWLYHGIPFDHSAYMQVTDLFTTVHPAVTEKTISNAISLVDIDRSHIALFPADDKGSYELAILSLFIFGPHVSSFYFGVFLLLGISAVIFALHFKDDQTALNVLALFFCALLVCIPAFAVTKELYSLTNPRVFGVLAVIPFLHVTYTLGKRLTWQGVALCFAQSLLLVECIQVRSTEAWAFIALLLVAGIVLCRYPIKCAWPAAIAFATLALLPIYQSATYHSDYFGSNLRGRLFWHNVGIGLSLSPKLSQRYGLTFSDHFATVVAEKAKRERGDIFTQKVFGKTMAWTGEFADARAYEILARDFIFEIVNENKFEVVKLFVITKPIVLVKTLSWLAGRPVDEASIYVADQIGSLATSKERVTYQIYWRPFTLPILLCLLVLTYIGKRILLWPLGIAFSCSLIAPMVAYPIVHTLAVPLLLLTMLLFGIVIKLSSNLREFITRRTSLPAPPLSV